MYSAGVVYISRLNFLYSVTRNREKHLNGAEIHRLLDDGGIIEEAHLLPLHRSVKRLYSSSPWCSGAVVGVCHELAVDVTANGKLLIHSQRLQIS